MDPIMASRPRTLYEKIWDAHVVETRDDGTALIYIDRHLVHEVTSPQAFEGLRQAGRAVWRVSSIVATSLVSTRSVSRKSILFAPDMNAHAVRFVPVLFDSGRSPGLSI